MVEQNIPDSFIHLTPASEIETGDLLVPQASQIAVNLDAERTRVPRNYWNPETIEQRARLFYESVGGISQRLLTQEGQTGLAIAIVRKYPGGMLQLKATLGVELTQRPSGFWSVDKIEQEAQEFCQLAGCLTHPALHKHGRADLAMAINRSYPHGITALKEKLNISSRTRPSGYWTPENIEQEASAFYQNNDRLTHYQLAKQGLPALSHAIATQYPGGINILREKLGIAQLDIENNEAIPTDEANSELRKLLEEQL